MHTPKLKDLKNTKDWKRYKFLKAKLQKESRIAHGKYMEDIISTDHKEQPKRFWSYIKSRKQESTGIVTLKDIDGLLHSDTPTKASILNQQFQSVYTKEDIHNMPHMGPSPFRTMDNIRVSQAGVYKLLRGLRPFKATGPDEIPAYILKEAAEHISPYLTIIHQKSLDTGAIPDDWRAANIVPVFKKGEKHKASNYRPVSLTSICCKLLEHIVHSTIMDHFDRHQILCDHKHGFRSKRSCETTDNTRRNWQEFRPRRTDRHHLARFLQSL